MLAIRFQRVGRKGHAEFRLIVQEARRTPSSGRVVARLGHFNPHTKATTLDAEKAAFYLNNGAQPSSRAALLLQKEGVKLPDWVKIDSSKTKSIKNTDKLRRNQPAVEPEEPTAEEIVAEAPAPATETLTPETAEAPEVTESVEAAEEAPKETSEQAPEASEEAPAETKEA